MNEYTANATFVHNTDGRGRCWEVIELTAGIITRIYCIGSGGTCYPHALPEQYIGKTDYVLGWGWYKAHAK